MELISKFVDQEKREQERAVSDEYHFTSMLKGFPAFKAISTHVYFDAGLA